MRSQTTSALPKRNNNAPVESGNMLRGRHASEIHFKALRKEDVNDEEYVCAAALFGHFTSKQVGDFMNDLNPLTFWKAFNWAMTTDNWKDEDQIELLLRVNGLTSALLSAMLKGNEKQQALQRIKTTADEHFRQRLIPIQEYNQRQKV